MMVSLSKEGLESLVKGTCPHYNIFNNPLVVKNRSYMGGFHDKWDWRLVDNTEEELWELYKLCKDSWN